MIIIALKSSVVTDNQDLLMQISVYTTTKKYYSSKHLAFILIIQRLIEDCAKKKNSDSESSWPHFQGK